MQDSVQAVLNVQRLALHQLARRQQGSHFLRVDNLQCTGRNQASRISCAMLRASLRSDFTGIV
ncbi:hypothetical protein ACFQX9_17290 [Bradyrhizobium sp. GCM10028915]|uniref:hypothetical protein n=1 Tax=Bradyrhizobium sp. GCM10028915 TaxID=3273385 RepID=UPI003605E195